MKKKKVPEKIKFQLHDLIPADVMEYSMLAAFFLLFPCLTILTANGFNHWEGLLTERIFIWILFVLTGAIGPKLCRKILMIFMLVLIVLWDIADLFCFLQLRSQIDPVFLRLLETTNANECAGFLKHTLFRASNLILLFYPLCGLGIWLFGKSYRIRLFPAVLLTALAVVPLLSKYTSILLFLSWSFRMFDDKYQNFTP